MKVKVISPTIQEFDGERFYLCGNYFQHKGKRLHVAVWRYHNGEIPKGYHVHHIDEDRTNNQIENLRLMVSNMHLSMHQHSDERRAYQQEHIKDMRELASEWHRSEAGREMHKRLAEKQWENAEPIKYICTECGKEFESRHHYGPEENHFCGPNCKAAFRRHSRKDDVERVCAYCGKTFRVNRYSKAECCSRDCAVKRRWNK
jgi:DNA-directed RNA polymerase subunit RPC12/RpoP